MITRDMVGGVGGLDLSRGRGFPFAESTCCAWMNSGRAALECLLRSLPTHPQRAFVPRYTCDTVLTPFARLGIPIVPYEIELSELFCPTRLRLPAKPEDTDLLMLTNYFGITEPSALHTLASEHPGPCIIDATTALFAPQLRGLPTFYSPRKFAGLPDGGIAVAPFPLQVPQEEDRSAHRALALLRRMEDDFYTVSADFDRAEQELTSAPPRRISPLTRALVQSIDWPSISAARLHNYSILHAQLREKNHLILPQTPPSAPLCYPFVSGIPHLRDELIDAGLVLPLYWPEVITGTDATAPSNALARSLLPLPVDQHTDAHEVLLRCGKL